MIIYYLFNMANRSQNLWHCENALNANVQNLLLLVVQGSPMVYFFMFTWFYMA